MINFERLIYMRQPFLRKVLTGILMRELSQRTSQFTDSVIRRMTRVANKYGAVNLSQGFPDFDPPEAITDRLAEVAGEGPHQYALTWGAKNFRDALAAKQEPKHLFCVTLQIPAAKYLQRENLKLYQNLQ